jgi:hypothetical protein
LFDVNIEQRELAPAYWIGPVYEVRRGSWFYYESAGLRPCDENLANQLEEGYLKITPWRKSNLQVPRSSSQPRGRPTSLILDTIEAARAANPMASSSKQNPASASEDTGPRSGDMRPVSVPPTVSNTSNAPLGTGPIQDSKSETASNTSTYRLFGAHMNSSVTYQDGTTAWLTADDFMSRMSSTVYGRFGGLGGTKLVRGYTEGEKSDDERKAVGSEPAKDIKRAPSPADPTARPKDATQQQDQATEAAPERPKRSTLERQLSSLAGVPGNSSEDLAEEARQEEEKEMEDYRESDANEQEREIEHLILVTHGVGQRLGLRLDSINFIHDVNTLRKTMKAVYASAPDLQALNSQLNQLPSNCRVQVLPVCWRHLLDFPKQSVRQNRKELDLGDAEGIDEDEYPSLADITVDGVPAVRNLITDLAMDVLLYQSAYREHIAGIVTRECNRIYKLFKERNPSFSGRVSLVGHSLGSAVLFDILCRQREAEQGPASTLGNARPSTRHRISSRGSGDKSNEQNLRLDFECENFFALGSPIALFQMLKGRTVRGRKAVNNIPPESPWDLDSPQVDPFTNRVSNASVSTLIPISISSPKCSEMYNIFHPTDPIAYRLEPLISPAMAELKPQPLPYTKKDLFGPAGIANIGARVGQSVGTMWYSLTSGVASSLINRSLGITGEEQALPQDNVPGKTPASSKAAAKRASGGEPSGDVAASSSSMPVADEKKQQALAEAAMSSPDPTCKPTLIDSEMETLYAGFQRRSRSPSRSRASGDGEYSGASATRDRKMQREEAKVRALNSNGRVDYSIQEGVFDVSLLASIASHLSYWADEDVVHFMLGQLLKRGRDKKQ